MYKVGCRPSSRRFVAPQCVAHYGRSAGAADTKCRPRRQCGYVRWNGGDDDGTESREHGSDARYVITASIREERRLGSPRAQNETRLRHRSPVGGAQHAIGGLN